jgi:hypothetical protein
LSDVIWRKCFKRRKRIRGKYERKDEIGKINVKMKDKTNKSGRQQKG